MSNSRSDGYDDSDLAGLYALDALEGEELERFERLMAANPEVRAEVQGFRETAARLAATTAEPAPPDLRASVLDRLGAVRQEPVRLDTARTGRRPSTVGRVAAIAAALVLLAGVGLGGYLLGSGGPGEETAGADDVIAVLSREDAAVVPLEGSGARSARLVYSVEAGTAAVVADGMPAPPEGKVYELWRVRGEQATNAGLFRPDDEQVVRSVAELPLRSGDVMAVTVEPEGGSVAPTSPIVLSAEL